MNKLLSQLLQPNSIQDIVGQSHLIGDEKIITKMIETKNVFSIIFFGLPGIGKTSLANAICKQLNLKHANFNPTKDKKENLVKLLNDNLNNNDIFVIIIDEIHRMNKDKQDILLSYLEKGDLIIFGTTTENPYFMVNPAIRSRCLILELKPISNQEMFDFLTKISKKLKFKLNNNKIEKIVNYAAGDVRSALNVLDVVSKIYNNEEPSDEIFEKIIPNSKVIGSSYGNEFYDLQSAFHKSLRGSDVDAAIYYLARLIKIGDLTSIARRMIAMAYEDIGLANPTLASRVILGVNSAERLGFPEANQILSSLVIEMCLSPKSNSSYLAISNALNDLENGAGGFDIPNHLKDAHYKSAKKLGYGNYKYPHDYPNSWVDQQYLPKELKDKKYYVPNKNEIEEKMNHIHRKRKEN